MKSSRLLVPVHDRRRRTRILTLKNFGLFVIAVIVLFAGVSIYSEMGRRTEGNYGRLYGRQVQPAEPKQPTLDIVQEAPISDEIAADPMLVANGVREQYLGTQSATAAMVPATTGYAPEFVRPAPMTRSERERIEIVGDSAGVAIIQKSARKPELSGGIFKP